MRVFFLTLTLHFFFRVNCFQRLSIWQGNWSLCVKLGLCSFFTNAPECNMYSVIWSIAPLSVQHCYYFQHAHSGGVLDLFTSFGEVVVLLKKMQPSHWYENTDKEVFICETFFLLHLFMCFFLLSNKQPTFSTLEQRNEWCVYHEAACQRWGVEF